LRTRCISKIIRLTPKEHEHLKKQSEITGLTGEALIRSLIMGINIRPIPPDQFAEVLRQLSAIGNNINQIARVANMIGAVDKDDIAAVKSLQAKIWCEIKSL
jgi:hypothetical protein